MEQVLVPDIGDFDEVPVIEVLVAVGDEVSAEDPLVVLESDKATMEVPSPSAGKVAAIKVAVGDKVKEGSLIVELEVSGGERRRAGAPAGRVEESVPAAESKDVEAVEEPPPVDVARRNPASPQAGASEAPAYASPAVRRLARELGVDLSTVTGSGRKGRITKEDLQKPQETPTAPTAAPAASTSVAGLDLAPWPKVNFERYGEIERQPLTRIQKISGPNLARNWVMIPHVTHHDEADITELEAFRKRTNGEQTEAKVTMVALLAKAVVASLKAFPVVNSSLDGDDLVLKRYYNIGFAADTPNGLVVPVIKDADKKGILEIAQDLTSLSKKARDGKLGGGDMQGSTFTISSSGRDRRDGLHADRQCARGGDSRRHAVFDEAGVERVRVRAAADGAVVAFV